MADTHQPVHPQRGSGCVLGGLLAALAVNTLPAWLTWNLLENPAMDTVTRSDVDTWLLVVAIAAIATVVGVVVALWSSRRFALGLVLGITLAGIAVTVGLYLELVTSGGSITG